MKINGNLLLIQDTGGVGVSFIENAVIERFSSTVIAAFSTPDNIPGRLVYNTTTQQYVYYNGTAWTPFASGGGSGTVTSVSVVPANGVSGSVATSTTTPAITLTLNNITPTTVNGLTLASQAVGFTIAGGTTSKTLTVSNTATVSGTNTGDQTIVGTTNRVSAITASGTTTLDIDAAYVGQASITTVGTIATGTWNATAITATKGGTGQTSYAIGDILYANTTSTLAKLADVATGSVLLSGGVSTAPSWGKVALTTAVSGVLPSTNGGTGVNNFSAVAGTVPISDGSGLMTSNPIQFVYDSTLHGGAKKVHQIVHNLGQQFVTVNVYDQTPVHAVAIASQTTTTFVIAGVDLTADLVAGVQFLVTGSTSNDGSYTVVSSTFSTDTTITTVESHTASQAAPGTLQSGPEKIIPQQIVLATSSTAYVVLNSALNITVVVNGVTHIAPA